MYCLKVRTSEIYLYDNDDYDDTDNDYDDGSTAQNVPYVPITRTNR
jgi:hypothetical protein